MTQGRTERRGEGVLQGLIGGVGAQWAMAGVSWGGGSGVRCGVCRGATERAWRGAVGGSCRGASGGCRVRGGHREWLVAALRGGV